VTSSGPESARHKAVKYAATSSGEPMTLKLVVSGPAWSEVAAGMGRSAVVASWIT
jgi:hypothetical protein